MDQRFMACLQLFCVSLLLLALGFIAYQVVRPKKPYEVRPTYPKLPIVGARSGDWFPTLQAQWRNSRNIKASTNEAYEYKTEACLFPILDMGKTVILPPTEIPWFQEQPESNLSAHHHQINAFQLEYTVTDPRLFEATYPIHDVLIKTTLTRQTDNLLPDLAEEIRGSIEDSWGTDHEEYKELCLIDEMPDIVGRVVNRAFCGKESCRNSNLVNAGVTFARGMAFTSLMIRCTPVILRPVIALFLTIPQRVATWKWFKELRPDVDRRLQRIFSPVEAKALKGAETDKRDFLQWTLDAAIESGDPYMRKPETLMGRILWLNFVAIHTTSFAITHVLFDLAANNPDYIQELRDEVQAALIKHGGAWNKRTLEDMPKVDSTFRESQRMNSIVTVASPKPVSNPAGITTPSGVHLPYGAYVGILSYPILNDPVLYPKPAEFQPFRFSQRRAGKGDNTDADSPHDDKSHILNTKTREAWISVTREFTAFGTGRHACPGRFFAANTLKVMLAWILMNYDIEKLPERPQNTLFTVSIIPPLKGTIRIKRRKEPLFQWS